MEPGAKLRLRGPAGAPFAVTVGRPFSADYIEQQLASGEWRQLDDDSAPAPSSPASSRPAAPAATEKTPEADVNRPAVNAPKSAWIAYAVRRGLISHADATAYTKADLIDLTS